MAEETKGTGAEQNTPTVEDLMAELSAARADADRYKSANDKLSKESADYKRQLRAKQTEEEQKAEEMAEAQRIRDEEFEKMKTELNHNKAVAAYKDISDEKIVEALIKAVSDADHSKLAQIISKQCENAVAEAQQTWLSERQEVNYGGSGSPKTKEEIMAVKDATERQRLIAENMELF